jgi:hypothetical protein
LRHDGAGADHVHSRAPGVPSSTDLIQPSLGSRQILSCREGALASAIDGEDLPLADCSIHELASLPLCAERAGQHLFQKEHAQNVHGLRGEAGKKATER